MTAFLASLLLFAGSLALMHPTRTLVKTTRGRTRGAAYLAFILFGLSALGQAVVLLGLVLKLAP